MNIFKDKLVLILFFVGFLLYIPSLFGTFVWDDEDFVYANQYVKDFRVDKFFTESVTAGRGKLSNYFRPVQAFVYATVHLFFGFTPFWFHLTSILVHIAAAITIFYFLILLTKVRGPSFIVALLFLVHPVQTEAVSYISGLSDSLYVLFGFLCLIFIIRAKRTETTVQNYLVSYSFFLLCLLSKETGIIFLGLVLLLVFLPSLEKSLEKKASLKEAFLNSKNYRFILPYFVITVTYLLFHFNKINAVNMKAAWGESSPYVNSVSIRLASFIQNLPTYFSLLVFPKDLFMERDYTIKIANNYLPQILIFLGLNLGFVGLLSRIIKKTGDRFGLLFFYFAFWISFIPYSGLVLINGIFYEHFLYLPLVWFFAFWIFISALALRQRNSKTITRISVIALGAIIIGLSLRNIARQMEWNDSVRFYEQTRKHAPGSIRIINGLGMAYSERGNLNKAIQIYSDGIKRFVNVPNLYHNLANAYLTLGDDTNAEKYYLKALEVDPNFYFSVQSLAQLYSLTNQKEKLDMLLKWTQH